MANLTDPIRPTDFERLHASSRTRRPRRGVRATGLALAALALSWCAAPPPARAAESAASRSLIVLGPPQPVAAERLARMRTWHARYRQAMGPVRRALETVLAHPGDPGDTKLLRACLELEDAVLAIDRRTLLPAPDFAVTKHLGRALSELGDAATACLSGAERTLGYRIQKTQEALANTALALRPYRLTP